LHFFTLGFLGHGRLVSRDCVAVGLFLNYKSEAANRSITKPRPAASIHASRGGKRNPVASTPGSAIITLDVPACHPLTWEDHMRTVCCLLLGLSAALALVLTSAPPAESACCYFAAQDKDILQPAQKA